MLVSSFPVSATPEQSRLRDNLVRLARSVCVSGFLLSIAILSAGAQEFDAAPFDPAPVRIPSFEKGKSRPVTTMDLLEIRDEKGTSISPDGKYIAFVVGQAVRDKQLPQRVVHHWDRNWQRSCLPRHCRRTPTGRH
jgi:hypothetical protein